MERERDAAKGLDFLDDHDIAPEVNQLLNFGQHHAEGEDEPSHQDVRIARLSVVQTVLLSVLIAAVALTAVFFALRWQTSPNPKAPALPVSVPVETTPVEVTPALPATTPMPTTDMDVSTFPVTPSKPDDVINIKPSASGVEQILQGPAKDLIAWHYTMPKHQLKGPIVRVFETSILVRAENWGGQHDERMVVLTNYGDVRWELPIEPMEQVRSWGGNAQQAIFNVGRELRAFDVMGEEVWRKTNYSHFNGEFVSDVYGRWFNHAGTILYCIDKNGEEVWSYQAGERFLESAKPLLSKHILCVTKDGALHCLDYKGNLIWRKELGIGATPVRGKNGTYFAGSGKLGKFYKLDADGSVLWEAKTGYQSNLFHSGFIPLDDGGVIILNSHPNCVRYDANGNKQELFKHSGNYLPPYKVDNKRFATLESLNGISVYNLEGEYEYTFPLSLDSEHGYMIDPGGYLYLISGRHDLVAVKPLP